jgi:hypothetical protein
VEVDTSGYMMGAVLLQLINGKWRPVAFILKAEWNYKIYNKEMLAIMKVLEEGQQFLIRAEEEFEVWTDHLNLIYFWQLQKLNDRQNGYRRWWTISFCYTTNQENDMPNQISCQGIQLMTRENRTMRT